MIVYSGVYTVSFWGNHRGFLMGCRGLTSKMIDGLSHTPSLWPSKTMLRCWENVIFGYCWTWTSTRKIRVQSGQHGCLELWVNFGFYPNVSGSFQVCRTRICHEQRRVNRVHSKRNQVPTQTSSKDRMQRLDIWVWTLRRSADKKSMQQRIPLRCNCTVTAVCEVQFVISGEEMW